MGKASASKKVAVSGTTGKQTKAKVVSAIKEIGEKNPDLKECADKIADAFDKTVKMSTMSCYPVGVSYTEVPPRPPPRPPTVEIKGRTVRAVSTNPEFQKDIFKYGKPLTLYELFIPDDDKFGQVFVPGFVDFYFPGIGKYVKKTRKISEDETNEYKVNPGNFVVLKLGPGG